MRLNTDGLIIREYKTGESDRIVTVLTSDSGLIKAFVNGGRSIKSRKLSATQLMSYSKLSVHISRDTYVIDEAEPVEVFFDIRKDIVRTALAQYFCQLLEELTTEGENSHEILSLALNTLHKLSANKLEPAQLKAIFELRLLSLTGFMPDIIGCRECGDYCGERAWFDIASSGIYCDNCRPLSAKEELTPGVLTAMRHICLSDPAKLFSFRLSPAGLKRLCEISEKYLLEKTGRRYKSLDFYRSIGEV